MLINHLIISAITLVTLLSIMGIVFLWVMRDTKDFSNCSIILFIISILIASNITLLIYEFY